MSVRVSVFFAALGATVSPMAFGQQVHKCMVDGNPVYQQEPCALGGSQLRVFAGGGDAPAPGAHRQVAAAPRPPERAPDSQPASPRATRKSDLEREADMCLDWYRERLRDPRSAYYVDPSKDGRVLSIYVKATNGFGGYVTKLAKCEVKDGVIDSDWTRIHANRNQW